MEISALMNRRGITPFQWRVIALCFLIVTLDGFDTAAIGYLAPAIRSEWTMATTSLGTVFGAGLGGLMLGCFIFGPLADRIGRKRVLILSVVLFALGSIASAFVHSPTELAVMRFITGIGLGGAMPNAITLSSEYCAERMRSLLVTATFCGFTLGFAIGGEIVAQTLPHIGWRGVLIGGGVVPLLVVPILMRWLPESMRYLAARGDRADQLLAIARHIDPQVTRIDAEVAPAGAASSAVGGLFTPRYLVGTLLLWATYFCTLCAFYLLTSWLPLIVKDSGYTLAEAARIGAMLPLGGTVGAVMIGFAMDRTSPYRVLAASYVMAGVALCVLGAVTHQAGWLMTVVFLAGFGIAGSQTGANALTAAYYPTASRATGVAWALGVGRLGSILGSSLGGVLIATASSTAQAFQIVAIPAFLAAGLMLVMRRRVGRGGSLAAAATSPAPGTV